MASRDDVRYRWLFTHLNLTVQSDMEIDALDATVGQEYIGEQ